VRGHEAGETPPGLEPRDYRARSTRFTLRPGESFRAAVERQLSEALGAPA